MNYYDGQIITDHKAFANWTNANGNKFYDTANGDGTYTVHEIVIPEPTHEEIAQIREQEYARLIDPLHARKLRRTVLGKWTEEDEAEYVEKVTELSAKIAEEHPYPEEKLSE